MRRVRDDVLDDLWRLLPRLQGTADRAAGDAADPVQERVDRVHAAAVAASLVGAPGSAGGFVTRLVVDRLTGRLVDVAQTSAAATAVLGLCAVAGVDDPRQRHALVVECLTGRPVPPTWQPPTAPVERGALRSSKGIASLHPDEGRLWQAALSRLPVVGVAGEALAARDGVNVVVGRACTRLGLPGPSGTTLRAAARTAGRELRDRVRRR